MYHCQQNICFLAFIEKSGFILSHLIKCYVINETLIRIRRLIQGKTRRRKWFSMRRRVKGITNIDLTLLHWYFQCFHFLETPRFHTTISPTKNGMLFNIPSLQFSSFIIIRCRCFLRGFRTLVSLILTMVVLLCMV